VTIASWASGTASVSLCICCDGTQVDKLTAAVGSTGESRGHGVCCTNTIDLQLSYAFERFRKRGYTVGLVTGAPSVLSWSARDFYPPLVQLEEPKWFQDKLIGSFTSDRHDTSGMRTVMRAPQSRSMEDQTEPIIDVI